MLFTWNPVLNWINRDLFIRDMRSGNPDSAPYFAVTVYGDGNRMRMLSWIGFLRNGMA